MKVFGRSPISLKVLLKVEDPLHPKFLMFQVLEMEARVGLGQVTSGKKRFADGTWFPGEQFENTFDDIGNRTSTKLGGDSAGSSLGSASYSPTLLNQYSSRTVPNAVDVLGIANTDATVTVNSQST